MTTNPTPEPTEPKTPVAPEPKKATTPATRKTRKAATPATPAKVTPKAKPVTKKAATPTPIFTKKGWQVALTRNQALAAYRKQRTLLHGAGPETYRKAAAKALGVEDEVFEAAFYIAKAAPKADGKA